MSALSSGKLKTNCDAVHSGSFINHPYATSNINSSNSSPINASHTLKNGTKLNQQQQQQQQQHNKEIKVESASSTAALKQKHETSSVPINFHLQSQKLNEVQKVLKQEQELQKQLYSGSNVAPGWLRVNHNKKVIYIR